mmetsp:Transcript_43228/g.85264  ORF Transcript_43228/g.85264 Transcript_43228/m.85264 type:complete len:363 (+) Transcript_43228:1016-2104(+)
MGRRTDDATAAKFPSFVAAVSSFIIFAAMASTVTGSSRRSSRSSKQRLEELIEGVGGGAPFGCGDEGQGTATIHALALGKQITLQARGHHNRRPLAEALTPLRLCLLLLLLLYTAAFAFFACHLSVVVVVVVVAIVVVIRCCCAVGGTLTGLLFGRKRAFLLFASAKLEHRSAHEARRVLIFRHCLTPHGVELARRHGQQLHVGPPIRRDLHLLHFADEPPFRSFLGNVRRVAHEPVAASCVPRRDALAAMFVDASLSKPTVPWFEPVHAERATDPEPRPHAKDAQRGVRPLTLARHEVPFPQPHLLSSWAARGCCLRCCCQPLLVTKEASPPALTKRLPDLIGRTNGRKALAAECWTCHVA